MDKQMLNRINELAKKKKTVGLTAEEQAEQKKTTASGIPLTFHEFMQYYFERYRVRKVAESTLTNDKYRYKNHILPAFGSMTLEQITDDLLQNFVDDKSVDSLKTAKECNSLISGMFDFAVLKKIVEVNPCKLVIVEPYESEHGVALTREVLWSTPMRISDGDDRRRLYPSTKPKAPLERD